MNDDEVTNTLRNGMMQLIREQCELSITDNNYKFMQIGNQDYQRKKPQNTTKTVVIACLQKN